MRQAFAGLRVVSAAGIVERAVVRRTSKEMVRASKVVVRRCR